MTIQFETENIEIEELDNGILVVGFYTEENYLMIQQNAGDSDEQDVRFGMNTYHIERDDQSFGGYGGVDKVILRRDLLEVELSETGKENLQCDALKVNFQTDTETYELLSEKLGSIFGDSFAEIRTQ